MPRTCALRAALLAIVLVPVTACLATPPSAAVAANPIVKKINKVRRAHGVAPLRNSRRLSRRSKAYARRLMRSDRFAHPSRSGGGEILAMQPGLRVSNATAIRAWLRSPMHRSLVLSRRFRVAGAGVSRGRFGSRPASLWVVRFRRR